MATPTIEPCIEETIPADEKTFETAPTSPLTPPVIDSFVKDTSANAEPDAETDPPGPSTKDTLPTNEDSTGRTTTHLGKSPVQDEVPEPEPASPAQENSPRDEKPSTTVSTSINPPSAFERLPDEIIEQILQATDPNSFASLVLLNSKWRCISQQGHLYAYHLLRCDSYSAGHNVAPDKPASEEEALPTFRRLFAREVKRNLFEAYLRPKETTIKLISTSISSSSAPGGEGMQFSPSPRGHHVLAYNSSRVYVLDVREPELAVKRELKILRRPTSACIADDGSLLAILSLDMQVDLYDLKEKPPRRKQTLILDNAPRAMALSPCGGVLAAAYEGGIEVSSISSGALPTDRRAVKCDAVDSLAFSLDGTQLLGTTTTSHIPNTVILTAPYYDPGNQVDDSKSALWTTSILFPNTSRDCSHAVLLQESSSVEATWTFTYDRSFETFRAVRIDDLRNGTTYFTGPIPTASSPGPLTPCTLPAANYEGELVSAGFEGMHVWLYGIPEDLEAVPENNAQAVDPSRSPSLRRRNSGLSVRSPSRTQEANGARVPQWQLLCDKFRNTFVSGRKITELAGVSNVKWVSNFGGTSLQERLVVTARGVLPPKPITEDDGYDFVDGGRITLLDFDYGTMDGEKQEITIELGSMEPEVLEEEQRDLEAEVAIVRRRTVAQQRGNRGNVVRAATTRNREIDALLRPSTSYGPDAEDPLIPRRMMTARGNAQAPAATGTDEIADPSLDEVQEALDAPYTHASPRSGTTLRRAATAAAVNRQRNPQAPVAGPVEYRRADGRAEHPHESDADNWVPPPPPYTKEDPGVDLPAFLRHAPIPGIGLPMAQRRPATAVPPGTGVTTVPPIPPVPPLPHTTSLTSVRPELPRIRTSTVQREAQHPPWPNNSFQRAVSDTTNLSGTTTTGAVTSRRSVSGPSAPREGVDPYEDHGDIYDVSPIEPSSRTAIPQLSGNQTTSAMTAEQQSAGSLSSAAEHTPASTGSHPPTEAASPGSGISPARDSGMSPLPPTVQRQRTGETFASPVVSRLPSAQTWPKVPQSLGPSAPTVVTGYPHSAPISHQNNDDRMAAALPSTEIGQVDRLHYGQQPGSGAPRSVSNNFQVPRVPVGSRSNMGRDPRQYSQGPMSENQHPPPPPDQPLIISTPRGVAGAFDTPDGSTSVAGNAGPVLHAPVPRHPRPTSSMPLLQPTVERLERILSVSPGRAGGTSRGPGSSISRQPSLRHHTSLSRRQSRARRGALKNIQDAKQRGWTGRRKNKKIEEQQHNGTRVSGPGWTDVVWAANAPKTQTQTKEKKCTMM